MGKALHWIKVPTERFGGAQARYLLSRPGGREAVLLWSLLETLAGQNNDHGRIWYADGIPFDAARLAPLLYFSPEELGAALDTLCDEGLLVCEDGVLCLPGWDELQTAPLEAEAERARALARSRMQRYREKKAGEQRAASSPASDVATEALQGPAAEASSDEAGLAPAAAPAPASAPAASQAEAAAADCVAATQHSVTGDAAVTPGYARKERERETEAEAERGLDERKAPQRFSPPSLEAVSAYCSQRGSAVNPKHFLDYYAANGWMVGKNKMRDWRAAIRSWESNGLEQRTPVRRGLPPGAVLGENGIPIRVPATDDLAGIL